MLGKYVYRLFGARRRWRCLALTVLCLPGVWFLLHAYFRTPFLDDTRPENGNVKPREETHSRPLIIPHVVDNHFWERNCQPDAKLMVPGDFKLVHMCIYDPKIDVYISSSVQRNNGWEFHLVNDMLNLMLQDAGQFKKNGAVGSPSVKPATSSGRHTYDISLVDIGCNIGVFTLSAASRGFSVLAVDAMEISLKMLTASLLRNNLSSNVTLVNNAISNTPGSVMFQVDSINKGGSSVLRYNVSQRSMTSVVSAICLDDLVPYVPTNRVFLKMDIESFEANALRCADDFFSRLDVPYVLLEWMFLRNTIDGAYVIEYLTNRGLSPYSDIRANTPLQLNISPSWPANVFWIKREY